MLQVFVGRENLLKQVFPPHTAPFQKLWVDKFRIIQIKKIADCISPRRHLPYNYQSRFTIIFSVYLIKNNVIMFRVFILTKE